MERFEFWVLRDTMKHIEEHKDFEKLNDLYDTAMEIVETIHTIYTALEKIGYCEFETWFTPLIVDSMIRGRKRTQLELMEEIRSKSNINIVTCGSCGGIILEEIKEKETIHCHCCGYDGEPCDMPDLFYEGQKEEK